MRRITAYFDRLPDRLTTADLKQYFNSLIQTHSWSTIKLDRNGLQFFYRYTFNKQWQWFNIVKPPQVRRIPDILTSKQVSDVINQTKKHRYQVFFMTLYSMGLRLSEGLNLTVFDIDHELVLQHVLPKGLQQVRDYGLLSSGAKKLRLIIQLLLLPVHYWLKPTKETTTIRVIRVCPCCQHKMYYIGVTRKANIIRIMARAGVKNKERKQHMRQ